MKKVILFENVVKDYDISRLKYGLLVETIDNIFYVLFGRKKKQRDLHNEVIALNNVSFSVDSGEVLGIIGRNGAGKSTILKLISKITYPEKGSVFSHGSIGAFIELGAGLHYELTGRENIYLYASILGMKRRDIDSKFNDIVNFAGISRFLDMPIKKYSSGMFSRLGFSVCAFCDPDILLVDEVLAVGDASFQKKCLLKMQQFKKAGKTIVFISHNMGAVKRICTRVIWLEKGKIADDGKPGNVIPKYLAKSALE